MKQYVLFFSLCFFTLSFSLPDYKNCQNTNQLVWDTSFEAFVKRYFESKKGTYNEENGLISEQLLTAMGGPPEDIIRLKDSVIMAQACQAHQASVVAAVWLCPKKEKALFALVHYYDDKGVYHSDPRCTIFYKDSQMKDVYEQKIVTWVKDTFNSLIEKDYALFNDDKPAQVAKKELDDLKKKAESRIYFVRV